MKLHTIMRRRDLADMGMILDRIIRETSGGLQINKKNVAVLNPAGIRLSAGFLSDFEEGIAVRPCGDCLEDYVPVEIKYELRSAE